MAVINELLPPEMLERVFRLLPNRDLKNAVLVCRRWRDVGEAPSLWTWVSPHCVVRENSGCLCGGLFDHGCSSDEYGKTSAQRRKCLDVRNSKQYQS